MITVENLTRRFGSLVALDGVSFRLEQGEVVGFLGLNGAGKTTTMRVLTGFLPATSGRVEVCGFDVLRQSLEVRRRIGYLPESVPLYREHRVEEMLRFQARLHRLDRATAKRRIGEVLERVDLVERRRALIGNLSKGLRQRAGLAVALLPDPEVLILDEPTSGLDPLQRIGVRDLIRELAENRTVLLSSHILPEIEAVCPRVIMIHRGRIVADGGRAELERRHAAASHVRFEAVVGPDVDAAVRALRTIDGVDEVLDEGTLGIHRVLRIPCREDLREEVGAIAATKGWALRELSFQRQTLEELFASVALGLAPTDGAAAPPEQGPGPRAARAVERGPATAPPVLQVDPRLGGSAAEGAGASPAPTPQTPARTLNPFERFGAKPRPPAPDAPPPASEEERDPEGGER